MTDQASGLQIDVDNAATAQTFLSSLQDEDY